MMKKNMKAEKGFSLVETMIAVAIFSIAAVLLAGAFSSFIRTSIEAKKEQKNVEDAQYALNSISKTLRTSDLATTSFPLEVFDYSRTSYNCIIYNYDKVNKKIQVATTTDATPEDMSKCNWSNYGTFTDVTSSDIADAKVDAILSTTTSKGRVSISLWAKDATQKSLPIPVQMTVALRNIGNEASLSSTSTPCLYVYGDWSDCDSTGNQSKTGTASPLGCTGGAQTVTRTCVPSLTCGNNGFCDIATETCSNCPTDCGPCATPTCTDFTYGPLSPAICPPSQQQTQSVIATNPLTCIGGNPVLTKSCTFIPTCGNGTCNGPTENCGNCSADCGVCASPTCSDGIKNGTETGVDCGGSCTACPVPINGACSSANGQTFTAAAFESLKVWGDPTGDGNITAGKSSNGHMTENGDAMQALMYAVGDPTSTCTLATCDVAPMVNGVSMPDGVIEVSDALIILRAATGMSPDSPLCTSGVETGVTGTGPWHWRCVGTNGGTSVNCAANSN